MEKETQNERLNLMLYIVALELSKLMESDCGNSGENFWSRFKSEFGNPPWEKEESDVPLTN